MKADYALLLTFVGLFIFTGNMGRIEPVAQFLSGIADGREIGVGILTSQCISNVPAALLLSGFTHNIKNLALGVNIGGLGTLIASMASLISYKLYVNEVPEGRGKYFVTFTVYNVIFLVVLYACTEFQVRGDMMDSINLCYEMCDYIEQNGVVKLAGNTKLHDNLKKELLHFLIYISMIDGRYGEEEKAFIKRKLGFDVSASMAADIKNRNMLGAGYITRVPTFFIERERVCGRKYAN